MTLSVFEKAAVHKYPIHQIKRKELEKQVSGSDRNLVINRNFILSFCGTGICICLTKPKSYDEQWERIEGYMAQKEKSHKASNDRYKIRVVNSRYRAQTYWVAQMELPK